MKKIILIFVFLTSRICFAGDSTACEDFGFGPQIKAVLSSDKLRVSLSDSDYGVLALMMDFTSSQNERGVKYLPFADGLNAKSLPETLSYIGNSPVKNLARTQEIELDVTGMTSLSVQAVDGCGFISEARVIK